MDCPLDYPNSSRAGGIEATFCALPPFCLVLAASCDTLPCPARPCARCARCGAPRSSARQPRDYSGLPRKENTWIYLPFTHRTEYSALPARERIFHFQQNCLHPPCRYGYIDLQRYAWGALMKNQFGGSRDVEVGLRSWRCAARVAGGGAGGRASCAVQHSAAQCLLSSGRVPWWRALAPSIPWEEAALPSACSRQRAQLWPAHAPSSRLRRAGLQGP